MSTTMLMMLVMTTMMVIIYYDAAADDDGDAGASIGRHRAVATSRINNNTESNNVT